MRPSFTSTTTLAILALHTTTTHASPLVARSADSTAYTYMAISTSSEPPPTMTEACPTTMVYHESDCPSDCFPAPVAGMLGIVIDKFECMTPAPRVHYKKAMATSTCTDGDVVATFYPWGGGSVLGCQATN